MHKLSIINIVSLVLPILLFGSNTYAQGLNTALELNVTQLNGQNGTQLGIGGTINIGSLSIRTISGAQAFYEANSNYKKIQYYSAGEVCWDIAKQQIANDKMCNANEFKTYGKLETTFKFTPNIEFGFGYYESKDAKYYGVINKQLTRNFKLNIEGGENYLAIGVRHAF
jgi:hypothetical protein